VDSVRRVGNNWLCDSITSYSGSEITGYWLDEVDIFTSRIEVKPVSRIFETVKEVIMEGELQRGDVVIINGMEYAILCTHLHGVDGANSDVFTDAGIPYTDRVAFCTALYGYQAEYGDFPICKIDDYAALTRVTVALMVLDSLRQSNGAMKFNAECQEKLRKLRAEKDKLQTDIRKLEEELHA